MPSAKSSKIKDFSREGKARQDKGYARFFYSSKHVYHNTISNPNHFDKIPHNPGSTTRSKRQCFPRILYIWNKQSTCLLSTNYCGAGEVFTTSYTWAGCYQSSYVSSANPLFTGCTYMLVPTGYVKGIATCTAGGCFTQTIYQTYPDVGPMTNFICVGPDWPSTVVYRNIPLQISGTSTASSTSTNSTPSSTSSPSPTTTPTSSSSSSSGKAWIAGPVLGSLALLALICFGLWYIRNQRRRRAKSSQSPQPHNPDQQYLPETKAELPNDSAKRGGGEGGAERTISPELPTQVQSQNEKPHYEIDSRHVRGVELPSNQPIGTGRVELSS